jgi:hypothetical protein
MGMSDGQDAPSSMWMQGKSETMIDSLTALRASVTPTGASNGPVIPKRVPQSIQAVFS